MCVCVVTGQSVHRSRSQLRQCSRAAPITVATAPHSHHRCLLSLQLISSLHNTAVKSCLLLLAMDGDTNNVDKKEDNGIYIVIENKGGHEPSEKYNKKSIKIMAGLHITGGLVSILMATLKMILKSQYQRNEEPFSTAGEGFYCGLIFLVTGIIGLASLKKTNNCKISAFLVLSIFCSMFGFIMTLTTTILMARAHWKDYYPALFCHYVLIFCGLTELILGILSSSYSCAAFCGCCGGGGQSTPAAGASSVVYIPQVGVVQGDKPRVVHLNMTEINKSAILGDTSNGVDNEAAVNDEATNPSGKYSRFQ